MRVLVTGASGFLAGECVRELRLAGHEVIGTDRRGNPDILADLAEPQAVRRLPEADAIVHSAAVQYVSDDLPLVRRTAWFHRNNVVATRNLAARYAGSGAHFVNVGTSMVYAQTGRDEYRVDSPWRAQGLYTASKIEAQRVVDRMPDPTACVIPCIIGGEGRSGLFARLVGLIRRWHVAAWPGPGRHKVHLVHVRDAASLIVQVIERRATGRFNAASPAPLSIVEWVDEIASALHLGRTRRLAVPLTPVSVASVLSGYRLFAREQLLMMRLPHTLAVDESLAIGWTPAYSNAQVVRETALALARAV